MKTTNDDMKELIIHKVFKLFSEEKYEEARDVLLGLYNENYKDINDLKTKRLLLSNLAWVEDELGDKANAKKHIKIIKDAMGQDTKYIFDNTSDYCLVLNLYCELYKDELSIEEYINLNMLMAYFYKDNNDFGGEAVALTNVYLISNQSDKVIDLLRKLVEADAPEYYTDRILNALQEIDSVIYKNALHIMNGGVVDV